MAGIKQKLDEIKQAHEQQHRKKQQLEAIEFPGPSRSHQELNRIPSSLESNTTPQQHTSMLNRPMVPPGQPPLTPPPTRPQPRPQPDQQIDQMMAQSRRRKRMTNSPGISRTPEPDLQGVQIPPQLQMAQNQQSQTYTAEELNWITNLAHEMITSVPEDQRNLMRQRLLAQTPPEQREHYQRQGIDPLAKHFQQLAMKQFDASKDTLANK